MKNLDGLAALWGLSRLREVPDKSWNHVVKGERSGGIPVVLKIAVSKEVFEEEKRALIYFQNHGMIPLLDYSEDYNAFLLHQAVPGSSLLMLNSPDEHYTIRDSIYIQVMNQLHLAKGKQSAFSGVEKWLETLDKDFDVIPQTILFRARKTRDYLLKTSSNKFVLHGDLHQDNILLDGTSYIAIDPKGVVGEREFEAAAFDFVKKHETPHHLFVRIKQFASRAKMDQDRLIDWVFVRLALAAAWFIEDNRDPSFPLRLLELYAR